MIHDAAYISKNQPYKPYSVHALYKFSFRLILLLLYTVAQLNVNDLTTTEIDKLNLRALDYKISAGYFGKLIPIHYHSTFVLSLWSTGLTMEPLLKYSPN